MLLDFKVLETKNKEWSGAIQFDGTARFQTIFKRDENPFIFDLLTHLDQHYQVKALINTSFNSRGEPIVHTRQDAENAAQKMKLDGVVINGEFKKL